MSPAGWLLIAAAVLYLAAGWCAGAQAAIARGDAEHSRYISLLALIRVTAEVAAAVLVTLAFTHWLRGGWEVFLAAAGTLLVARYLLIGVRPREMGRQRAERTAATAARLLRPLHAALGPLPRLLDAVSGALPLGGGRDPGAVRDHDAELRGLVHYIEGRPEIEPGEQEMVRSVFELGDTIVREVMVPRTDIVFIERGKSISRALSLALRSGFSRIPVVGESTDDVVGIAYLKDIVSWEHEHPGEAQKVTVGEIMRPATYVPESKPVDELLRQMQSQRIHVAVVIDEYGGTAGLVTIEDLLEEIVGEIADEYDNERAPVEWLDADKARVTARLPVTELEDLFGVKVEAEDVETVGGLLAHELGRVPIAGSQAEVAGLRLTVENLAGRRNKLGTVLVERLAPEDPLSRTDSPASPAPTVHLRLPAHLPDRAPPGPRTSPASYTTCAPRTAPPAPLVPAPHAPRVAPSSSPRHPCTPCDLHPPDHPAGHPPHLPHWPPAARRLSAAVRCFQQNCRGASAPDTAFPAKRSYQYLELCLG